MKNTQLYWNAAAGTLAALVLAVIIWGAPTAPAPCAWKSQTALSRLI